MTATETAAKLARNIWDNFGDVSRKDLETLIEGELKQFAQAKSKQLTQLAIEVRAAQTRYFSTRQPADLNKAKSLESKLDGFLKKITNHNEEQKQLI